DGVSVIERLPAARVITIDASNLFTLLRDTLRFMGTARASGIDTTINLETFTRYSSILAFLSGARRRVGFHRYSNEGLYTGDLLTHRVAYSAHQHTWRSYMALAMALEEPHGTWPLGKVAIDDRLGVANRFETSEAAQAKVRGLLTALAPGFAGARRLVL